MLRHARFINGKTHGFFYVTPGKREDLLGYILWEDPWIIALEVARDFRGNGLAKELIGEALRRGIRKLSVNKKNTVAISLYRGLGFKVTSETKDMLFMEL